MKYIFIWYHFGAPLTFLVNFTCMLRLIIGMPSRCRFIDDVRHIYGTFTPYCRFSPWFSIFAFLQLVPIIQYLLFPEYHLPIFAVVYPGSIVRLQCISGAILPGYMTCLSVYLAAISPKTSLPLVFHLICSFLILSSNDALSLIRSIALYLTLSVAALFTVRAMVSMGEIVEFVF